MTAPNILIIMADQLAPHFTGAYGHPIVKTPNLDALATRGMRFDTAYCNSPICAPSRFSFMTGQLITRIAAYDNASEFSSAMPTFAHYLRAMGYRTCLSGKMHFVGPDQLHGFEDRITTDIYPADYAWTPDWEQAEERIDKWYHNMDSVREAGVAVTTYQFDYDDEVTYAARRQLFDYARDGSRPFCMVASFIHPHDPYLTRPEWWDLYDHDSIDLPVTQLDPADMDNHTKRLRDGFETSKVTITDEDIRNARHAYYANTSYVDAQVGILVQTLEEAGQLDNTVIIFTADHGDMLGERGLWFKMSFFEQSTRVPLIAAGPGVKQGVVGNGSSLVDMLPTLLDIAGQDGRARPEIAQSLDGRTLWPLMQTGEDPVDEVIGEYCAEMTGHPMFMIRRGRFKYIHCDGDPPLLYDIKADPGEVRNLATEPDHADLAAEFADEVSQRWESAKVRADVIATQKARRAIYEATSSGKLVSWDYEPPRDAANAYVRNHMDWAEATERYILRRPNRENSQ